MKINRSVDGLDYATLIVNRSRPRPRLIRFNQERDPLLKIFFDFFAFDFKRVADFNEKEIWGHEDKGISIVSESDKIIVSFQGAWWIRKKAFLVLKSFLIKLVDLKCKNEVTDFYFSRLDVRKDIFESSPTFLFGYGDRFGKDLRFKKFSKRTAFYPVQIFGTKPNFIARASLFNSRFQFQIYKKYGDGGEQESEDNSAKKKFYENLYRGKEVCRIELRLKYADTLKKYLPLFFKMKEADICKIIFIEWSKKNELQEMSSEDKWEVHVLFRKLFYYETSS